MAEYPYSSKFYILNDLEFYKQNFSSNSKDDTTKFDNNSNLDNIESNKSLIPKETVKIFNQYEIINNNELQSDIFPLFNDNMDKGISYYDFQNNNFCSNHFTIPFHINQDSYQNNENKNNNNLSKKNFLNKKRKRKFNVEYPNDFFIFSPGGENKNIIDEILQKYENQNNIIPKEIDNSLNTRKDDSDNIRKKIKNKFITKLKIKINQNLKNAGSKKFFKLLPHIFACNISKDLNRVMFDKTFKELFSINFLDSEDENNINFKNYKNNKDVLEYLEKEKDISEKSNYKWYKNLTFYQIFDEYLRSKEFENEIKILTLKGEKDYYIYNYISLAYNLNLFFS